MLPTRGICYGTFLLIHSARTGSRSSIKAWVEDARSMPAHLAAAVDLEQIAANLLRNGLADLRDAAVIVDRRLASVGHAASDEVLMTIAAILLEVHPPGWLHAATARGVVYPEYIPSRELSSLAWLGLNLNPLLLGLAAKSSDDDDFRKWLGGVGESLIVAAEKQLCNGVQQVSLISDSFGYDIESMDTSRRCLEIKTSVVGSEHQLFLSRHEADVAAQNPATWFLVHVILHPTSLTEERINAGHVRAIRQITASELIASLPCDGPNTRWLNVKVNTASLGWQTYRGTVPSEWTHPGYVRQQPPQSGAADSRVRLLH